MDDVEITFAGKKSSTVRSPNNLSVESSTKALKHINNHRKSTTPFQCRFCEQSFEKPSSLVTHQKAHVEDKPFQCRYCSRCFRRPENLLNHQQEHLNKEPYQCRFCSRSYIFPSDLLRHQRTHTSVKPFRCEKCSRVLSDLSDFVHHISGECSGSGEENKLASKNCKSCLNDDNTSPKEYESCENQNAPKKSVQFHPSVVSSESNETVVSPVEISSQEEPMSTNPVSGNVFTNNRVAFTSSKEIVEPDNRSFQCPDCKKLFKSSRAIKIHRTRFHKRCNLCGMAFKQLARHIRMKHGKNTF